MCNPKRCIFAQRVTLRFFSKFVSWAKHIDQMNLRVVLITTLFKAYIFCFLKHSFGQYVFELFVCETNLIKSAVWGYFLNKGYFLKRSHNRAIPASEALKNFWGPQKRFKFWILELKVWFKKLGIGSGLYGKSVLYLKLIYQLTN